MEYSELCRYLCTYVYTMHQCILCISVPMRILSMISTVKFEQRTNLQKAKQA